MRVWLVVIAWLAPGVASAADAAERTLCQATESVVFSCTVGAKLVSLCRPAGAAKRLSYRFGKPARVELAYPANGASGRFEWSSRPVFGGGITSVIFKRGDYEYTVYAKLGRAAGAAGGEPEAEDGVIVSRAGRRVSTLVCADGGAGFREGIEWLPRRAER